MNKYGYTREVNISFEEAIDGLTHTLQEQGFWVLSHIDIQEKMKEKLWENMDKYVILWACNPKLAFEALSSEIEIGLLLPCNVIVYESDSKVFISAIVPSVALSVVENNNLQTMAETAETNLKLAVDNV